MKKLTQKAIQALTLVALTSLLLPVAHADLTALKEKLAKAREARQQATPTQALTQAEVDRLLTAVPTLQAKLEEINPPKPTAEQQKTIAKAMMSGQPFSAIAQYLAGSDTEATLNTEAAALGYADYASYCDRADAVMKVLTAEQWILAARGITLNDAPKPAPIDNLWQYIHDQNVDAEEREKLSGQLDDMLERFAGNRSDAELVYNNIDAVRPVFQALR